MFVCVHLFQYCAYNLNVDATVVQLVLAPGSIVLLLKISSLRARTAVTIVMEAKNSRAVIVREMYHCLCCFEYCNTHNTTLHFSNKRAARIAISKECVQTFRPFILIQSLCKCFSFISRVWSLLFSFFVCSFGDNFFFLCKIFGDFPSISAKIASSKKEKKRSNISKFDFTS